MIAPHRPTASRLEGAAPEAVLHRATLALDAGEMGVFEWNAGSDAISCDENFAELWGIADAEGLTGETLFARVHPEDLASLKAQIAQAFETDEDYKAEFRVVLPEGGVRWLGARGRVTARAAEGLELTGLNWDVTETKRQERRLEHLAREMNHRVNNSFAVIEALLTLGARSSTDVRSFARLMRAQIHALADAHRLAADHALHSHERSSDVAVSALVGTALRAWTRSPGRTRIAIDVDPGVRLPAAHVSGMAMLLYELATNATKYGALGEGGGALDVAVRAAGDAVARLEWRETLDAPRPERPSEEAAPGALAPLPASSGFGTVLVQHCLSILGGTLDERGATERGFTAVVSFPCERAG